MKVVHNILNGVIPPVGQEPAMKEEDGSPVMELAMVA